MKVCDLLLTELSFESFPQELLVFDEMANVELFLNLPQSVVLLSSFLVSRQAYPKAEEPNTLS